MIGSVAVVVARLLVADRSCLDPAESSQLFNLDVSLTSKFKSRLHVN